MHSVLAFQSMEPPSAYDGPLSGSWSTVSFVHHF